MHKNNNTYQQKWQHLSQLFNTLTNFPSVEFNRVDNRTFPIVFPKEVQRMVRELGVSVDNHLL